MRMAVVLARRLARRLLHRHVAVTVLFAWVLMRRRRVLELRERDRLAEAAAFLVEGELRRGSRARGPWCSRPRRASRARRARRSADRACPGISEKAFTPKTSRCQTECGSSGALGSRGSLPRPTWSAMTPGRTAWCGNAGDAHLAGVGRDLEHVADLDVEHRRGLGMELRVAAPHGLRDRVRDLVQRLHAREPAVVQMVRRVHDQHRIRRVAERAARARSRGCRRRSRGRRWPPAPPCTRRRARARCPSPACRPRPRTGARGSSPAGTVAPSARAASSSTSTVARVSKRGRIVGCWIVFTPRTGSASPQASKAAWSGRTRSASSAVSFGAYAKLTVNTLPERSASARPTCGAV